MSRREVYRAALVAAILSAISWFGFVYGQLTSPGLSGIDDPQQYFQTIREAGLPFQLYGWGGVLGTLLMVPYLFAFYEATKRKAPLVAVAVLYAIIGVGLTVFGFFKPLIGFYTFVPQASIADPDVLSTLRIASAAAAEAYELPWNIGSFLLFGLGVGLIAYYAWRTGTGPAWLNWAGIIGGIAGINWLAPYIPIFPDAVRTILIILNILGIMIWSIGLSLHLSRQDAPQAVTS